MGCMQTQPGDKDFQENKDDHKMWKFLNETRFFKNKTKLLIDGYTRKPCISQLHLFTSDINSIIIKYYDFTTVFEGRSNLTTSHDKFGFWFTEFKTSAFIWNTQIQLTNMTCTGTMSLMLRDCDCNQQLLEVEVNGNGGATIKNIKSGELDSTIKSAKIMATAARFTVKLMVVVIFDEKKKNMTLVMRFENDRGDEIIVIEQAKPIRVKRIEYDYELKFSVDGSIRHIRPFSKWRHDASKHGLL